MKRDERYKKIVEEVILSADENNNFEIHIPQYEDEDDKFILYEILTNFVKVIFKNDKLHKAKLNKQGKQLYHTLREIECLTMEKLREEIMYINNCVYK